LLCPEKGEECTGNPALIAKDLKRMQVWVPANEADIGQIHAGQAVTFTIDAHPGETFRGTVGKIRLNAAMTQNVVNYTVEVVTDNSGGKLLPYLTANVQFEIDRHDDVLAGQQQRADRTLQSAWRRLGAMRLY
jgi:HlyD family secretion protein